MDQTSPLRPFSASRSRAVEGSQKRTLPPLPAVTRADENDGTVLLVIQSTQQSTADARPQIVKYRIQVELQKVDDRWLLSGIAGL